MKPGDYVVEVRTVEGLVFQGCLNVRAVVSREEEPVSVAIDEAHVPQLMTTLSVMMSAAESRFWMQQREIGAVMEREAAAVAALRAEDARCYGVEAPGTAQAGSLCHDGEGVAL